MTPTATPTVHTFDDTREAYDAVQCDGDIRDGDVLVIPSERVVAIVYLRIYPVALTVEHGELHQFECAIREIEEAGEYEAAIAAAEEQARGNGWDLHTPAA
ncbi:hypothetical protein [Streptomyces chilikensis]|uniref:Uncharacterized protein n=1 Tax=Streptomyces chilikensis TaxID=1194079 RepID=A0ABV3EJE7_9ACTN